MKIRNILLPAFLGIAAIAVSAQTSSQLGQTDPYAGTQQCSQDMAATGLCVPANSSGPNARGNYNQPQLLQPSRSQYISPLGTSGLMGLANPTDQFSPRTQSSLSPAASAAQPAMIPLPPEPLTNFQKFIASTTQQVLPIFGASLFRQVPSTFSPLDQGPVPSDYVLGPGDQVRIQVWGQVNFSTSLRIDRTGNIYLPQVGEVHLAGVRVSSLETVLNRAVSRVFRNFNLTASVGQIRSIQVYVVGQARRAGVYTISSLSTLTDALFASGGPSPEGSMRRIQLRRNGKVIANFDLYDLLLHGDRAQDLPLQSGDVIFIPPVGEQAAITGSVKHPAIYELRPGETIGQLIQNAGGPSTIAAKTYISIDRIVNHQDREAMQVSFNSAGLSTPVASGDLIRIHAIAPLYKNTVTLRGNTANPGRFAWHPGMRLSDLIPNRDSLVTRNYWWRRAQLGLPSPQFEPLQRYPSLMQPNRPVDLLSGKSEKNQSRQSNEQIQNQLEQQNGSRLNSSNTSSTLASQALIQTENTLGATPPLHIQIPAPDIDWAYAVIERLNPRTLRTTLIPFDLGKLVLDHDQSQNLLLQPGDVVTIFSQGDIHVPLSQQTKFVRLEGEFKHAGIYSVKPGETLRELVEQAGGLTPEAYLYGSSFTRVSTKFIQQQRLQQYIRNLSLEIQQDTLNAANSGPSSSENLSAAASAQSNEQQLLAALQRVHATGRIVLNVNPESRNVSSLPNIVLQDGDEFVVPAIPSTVEVIGAVYDQNSFLYNPRQRVGDYLKLAGGANQGADRHHEFLIRADGAVVSRTDSHNIFGNNFRTLPVYPGDTIVVPEKLYKPSKLLGALQYTQLFSQLALGAAAINVLK
jgi:protein involved in polysaccharide export with SLBB domain